MDRTFKLLHDVYAVLWGIIFKEFQKVSWEGGLQFSNLAENISHETNVVWHV